MTKDDLKRSIAETAYNVGFGAKKHFATFDTVEKAPGWIGFISLAASVLSLIFPFLAEKLPSAILIIVGVASLYISMYRSSEYEAAGKELTQAFNELRSLYRETDGGGNIERAEEQLAAINSRYYQVSISRQILFSDWWAHVKFFGQHQIEWLDAELKFGFWKDKVPATLKLWSILLIIAAVAAAINFGFFRR